ncbi:MAG: small subunit ribosomal protein [Thermoanaerobacteraceae bacterium]|uniref:Small ribosomal subunit protein uS8 n=1 Tax=Biomaibacter acetigenes TaxID=2316383 RepID=A0A3G2R1X2_9FIRM|nr:30S ribosomal protein S8 [Biomaibacter acetigenes]MDK2878589.1 small subunit ribosomal protein [Thermoanaerobacteraceae bacterium]RKL61698.1 30S ribosomal protein S8 [Thermoanaerobacteraceae bacterium SP2]AYO29430.1 30S ribosomal protein S8 [Biomaibacter acetigenes]MDN5302076.1 small subunit ribosomal protein [Thermoanaerobacteraceae bacterium]MDN5311847.1 small subunit ribosomal protein [Thermoanaerobacteraceae bacterium]
MAMTDVIADMLTRIRNANDAGHPTVEIPCSKLKKAIAQTLKDEGYIQDFEIIDDAKQGIIKIYLKYGPNKKKVITGIKRISKPGLRIYARKDNIPKVMGGLGTVILSTSRGIMTDKQARKEQVGGEVICYVW